MKTLATSNPSHSPRTCRSRLVRFLRGGAKDEQAQSLIELAIAMSVFTVIMLGVVALGRIEYAAIEVANAARAGVAYGAQNTVTAANIAGMQTAALNDGADIAGWKTVGLSATAKEACTCSNGTAITCANGATLCVSPAHIAVAVQVNTTATVDPLFYVPGLPKTYVLTGSAVMGVQQ